MATDKPKTVQKYRTVKTVKYNDHETALKMKPADSDKMRFRIRRRSDETFDLLMMERIREKEQD